MKKILTIILGVILSSIVFAGGLITPQKLSEIKDREDVVIIDYRWDKVPAKTIPGAIAILNKDVARTINGINGMILPKEEFEVFMSNLGIEERDTIVIVDDEGMMNATRLWWILKLSGHEGEIFVVDGQIKAWKDAKLPMSAPIATTKKSNYKAHDADKNLVATLDEVVKSIDDSSSIVIDTRSKFERVKGHIPNSVFIEWKNNITPEGTYKNKKDLQKIYTDAGITKDLNSIIPHCKSAVRSTQTMFALVEILGYNNVKNYDGSWIEYEASSAPKAYGM